MRYTVATDFLLRDTPFPPFSPFKVTNCIDGRMRPKSTPAGSLCPQLSLIDIKRTLTLSLASVPNASDANLLQNSKRRVYHLDKANDTLQIEFLVSRTGQLDPAEEAAQDSLSSLSVPRQHSKILSILNNANDHTPFAAKLERLRQYFPVSMTTMTTGTVESLLLSARTSRSTSLNASSYGLLSKTSSSGGTGSSQKSMASGNAITMATLIHDADRPIVELEYIESSPGLEAKLEHSSEGELSIAYLYTGPAHGRSLSAPPSSMDQHASTVTHRDPYSKGEDIDKNVHAATTETNITTRRGPQTVSTLHNAQVKMLLPVRFIIGSRDLHILAEYPHDSLLRTELLKRPGVHILSCVTDKVYMADPFNLEVLKRTTYSNMHASRRIAQAGPSKDAIYFPAYWIGTPEHYLARRVNVDINGHFIELLAPQSLCVYDTASPNFDPSCLAQFNRTAHLVGNAASQKCILRINCTQKQDRSAKTDILLDLVATTTSTTEVHIPTASLRSSASLTQMEQAVRRTSGSLSYIAENACAAATSVSQNSLRQESSSEPFCNIRSSTAMRCQSNLSTWSSMDLLKVTPIHGTAAINGDHCSLLFSSATTGDSSNSCTSDGPADGSDRVKLLDLSKISPDANSSIPHVPVPLSSYRGNNTPDTDTNADIDTDVDESNSLPEPKLGQRTSPVDLQSLFQKPSSSRQCLKQDSMRRIAHIAACRAAKQAPKRHVPEQRAQGIAPDYTAYAVIRPDDSASYAERCTHLTKNAYTMGLRPKVY